MSAGAPWDHGVGKWGYTLIPCVCWCVAPAGFASGREGDILRLGLPYGQGGLPLI